MCVGCEARLACFPSDAPTHHCLLHVMLAAALFRFGLYAYVCMTAGCWFQKGSSVIDLTGPGSCCNAGPLLVGVVLCAEIAYVNTITCSAVSQLLSYMQEADAHKESRCRTTEGDEGWGHCWERESWSGEPVDTGAGGLGVFLWGGCGLGCQSVCVHTPCTFSWRLFSPCLRLVRNAECVEQ